MSKNCEIVKDLLPLYADEVCTEESRKLVAEHIAHCSECRAELEKMGKHISVKAETDVNVMKRIRKRMRIEKITVGLISLAVVLGIGIFALLYMINTLGPMDVWQMSIGEDVRAEVDENGDLTLILKDYAATEDYLMPIVSDENGKYMGIDKDFDASKKEGFGVSLMQRKVNSFAAFETYDSMDRKIDILNVDEVKIDRFYLYDEKNNKEYTLWERD